MRSRHGPRRRLRTAAEFDAVFKRGARLPGRLFLLVVAQSRVRFDRLGLAVSRKVGGAVARNRARRLVRESFRRLPLVAAYAPAMTIVVSALPDLFTDADSTAGSGTAAWPAPAPRARR